MKIFNQCRSFINSHSGRSIERSICLFADWCERHIKLAVTVLLVVGIGLRIGYLSMQDHLGRDEHTYVQRIEQAAAEGFGTISPNSQRLMVYIGMLLKKAGMDSTMGMRCFNITCSSLWLLLVFFLARAVFQSSKAGLCCLALAAFNPLAIRLAGMILREPLHLLLFTCGIFCAIQIIRDVKLLLFCFLFGGVCVLAAWSRLEGLEMLLWMPLALLIYFIRSFRLKNRVRWTKILTGVGLYLISLCLTGWFVLTVSSGYISGLLFKANTVFRGWRN